MVNILNLWALAITTILGILGILLYLALHYSIRPNSKPGGIEDPVRRMFLKYAVLSSFLILFGQLWTGFSEFFKSLLTPVKLKPVFIGKVQEIEPGTSIQFIMPVDPDMIPSDHPCVLIRFPSDIAEKIGKEFVAYSARCTHLGCIVEYLDVDGKKIYCPCHAGIFDPKTGNPISGPPKKPLPEVKIRVENGSIYAVGWVSENE